jgi:hypothetical protein
MFRVNKIFMDTLSSVTVAAEVPDHAVGRAQDGSQGDEAEDQREDGLKARFVRNQTKTLAKIRIGRIMDRLKAKNRGGSGPDCLGLVSGSDCCKICQCLVHRL